MTMQDVLANLAEIAAELAGHTDSTGEMIAGNPVAAAFLLGELRGQMREFIRSNADSRSLNWGVKDEKGTVYLTNWKGEIICPPPTGMTYCGSPIASAPFTISCRANSPTVAISE